ncbi:hypothetical protein VSK91_08120 [Bacillus swezeyi]|uniref:hypothetical protein n=1 Tax=Bacillus swezeyi TaxID=1925020 RepID=UPI0039C5F7E8
MKKNASRCEVFFHPDDEHSNDCIAEVQLPVENKKTGFHPLSRKGLKYAPKQIMTELNTPVTMQDGTVLPVIPRS